MGDAGRCKKRVGGRRACLTTLRQPDWGVYGGWDGEGDGDGGGITGDGGGAVGGRCGRGLGGGGIRGGEGGMFPQQPEQSQPAATSAWQESDSKKKPHVSRPHGWRH